MVGTLAWVANWTRPELAFAVHKLQRTQINPEPKHFEAVQRAFRYLKGTQSESLRLGGDLVLRAYSDADFCNDRVDGKSVTGYILFWVMHLLSGLQSFRVLSLPLLWKLSIWLSVQRLRTSCGFALFLLKWGVLSMNPLLLWKTTVPVLSGPMTCWLIKEIDTSMCLIILLRGSK
ncbi:unnamed protein product [Heterosigma akashiwo]